MTLARLRQRLSLIGYLTITLAAFVFTMTRVAILPRVLFQWSYGMMAPYQTFATINADMVARGQDDSGRWHSIALEPYYPYAREEANVRAYLLPWRWTSLEKGNDRALRQRYRTLARLLLSLEEFRGRHFRILELWWEEWPVSPGGYSWLRTAPFVSASLLARVP